MVDDKRFDGEQDHKLDEKRLASLLELNQLACDLDEKEFIQKALICAVQLTKSQVGYIDFFDKDNQTIRLITWPDEGPEQYGMA